MITNPTPPRSHAPTLPHLTWVEINLNAISHNFHQIKSKVQPAGAEILAVVKDNAYGHGTVEVAKIAAGVPVKMLGVAMIAEALELREAEVDLPILSLCCILPEQAEEVVRHDITQTVCELSVCAALSREAVRTNKQAKVHVKIDTGMGRIGVQCEEAAQLIERIAQLPGLTVQGIFTHFAAADTDEDFTNIQLERFNSVISCLNDAGIRIPLKHAANSAALLGLPHACFDMVRPGLMIYGLYPSGFPSEIQLKPALSLKTRIVHLKTLPAGWGISYGRTHTTKKPSVIASLAIGYGHGYNRRLSNIGEAIIRGVKAPIVGTVCMDQCLCDVTHISGASVGDEAVLIGRQGSEEITADEVAKKVGTISYEILCAINARVPRIYKRV